MMTTSFEDIFSEQMVEEALSDLESKRDGCGVDGVYLSQIREYWEINHEDILEMLVNETYDPGVVRETEIINNKGKKRQIALYNSIDRLILRCISQKLQQECDDLLEDKCFAFRNNMGVEAAVKVATEINKTSLDVRIGFVHSTTTRNQSLNLDIADIFKPVIVDRAIFSLINLKMIHVEEHFEKLDNGAVYLNSSGKRLFINALDEKIYEKQTENNHPLSYETRIRQEVSKVFRFVIYDEKYKPYKYQ